MIVPQEQQHEPTMFGQLVKTMRSERRLGLREFCLAAECDPSNWSKVERGLLPPPQEEATLALVAAALQIGPGSTEWETLVDAAKIGAGRIPDYVMAEPELVKKLPLFFRTLGGRKPSRADLERLAQVMRDP